MNRLCIATLASVLVCGPAFAQGRLPSPALSNPVITGGTISGAAGGFTTLSVSGAVSGAGIAALLASPGPIGSVGADTGAFTTLGVTGNVTIANPSSLFLATGKGLNWNGSAIAVSAPITAQRFFTGDNLQAPSGGSLNPILFSTGHFSGSTNGTQLGGALNAMTVSSDTMDCTGGGGSGNCSLLYQSWNFSGAAKGSRVGVWAQMNPSSLTNSMSIIPLEGTITVSSAMGGSFLQPLATQVTVAAGSSNVGSTLNEMDYTVQASGVGIKGALQVTLGRNDTVAGTAADAAVFFTNSNYAGISPGMGAVIALGNTNQGWPINPTTGKVIGINLQTSDQGNGAWARLIPTTLLDGIDLGYGNFTTNSGYSFVSPGFAIDAKGQASIANALIGTTTTGIKIDVPNQIVTAVSVSVAGTPSSGGLNSYHPGDILQGLGAPSHGQYTAAATKVFNATVSAGGTGGTNGACTVTDASGAAGTPFQLSGTVTGGVLAGALTVAVPGSYAVENPSGVISTTPIPVTGCGLTGATVRVGMGILTASILVPDTSATAPATITMAGGSGSGAVLTPTWTTRNTLQINPSGGAVQIGSGAFSANGSVATTMTSLGPTGSHTTVQEWLTITDASGTVRYIPAY